MKKHSLPSRIMKRSLGIAALFIFSIFISCAADHPSADDRTAVARAALEEKIKKESQGAIKLSTFNKDNGIEESQTSSTIEWSGSIEFLQEGWKYGDAIAGYWQDFTVVTDERELTSWGSQPKHFKKGSFVRLTGTCTIERTDNGWRVEEITSK